MTSRRREIGLWRALWESVRADWKLARERSRTETTKMHPVLVQRIDADSYRLTFISNTDETTTVAIRMNRRATEDLSWKLHAALDLGDDD